MLWLLTLLLGLAGLLRACHDALTHSPGKGKLARLGPWWDSATSWKRKYKNGDKTQGPAYPGATSWLIGFSDAWHASNTISWGVYDAAFVLAAWQHLAWWALVPVAVRRVVFAPVYQWLRK